MDAWCKGLCLWSSQYFLPKIEIEVVSEGNGFVIMGRISPNKGTSFVKVARERPPRYDLRPKKDFLIGLTSVFFQRLWLN